MRAAKMVALAGLGVFLLALANPHTSSAQIKKMKLSVHGMT